MPDDTDLQLPLEIPWKLASTTLPLSAGEPDQTSISLFFHEVDDAVLTSNFPEDKLVFLKVAVSISPASFPVGSAPLSAEYLGEGVPCYHVLLDLKVRPQSGATGTIKPYFHAAAPLNRRMLQTGIVGGEAFEGEASGQSIGKSGSQLNESLSSESRTNSLSANASVGIGPFSVGGSVQESSTALRSDRAVTQNVDTTMRQASEERRELVSHSTKVENILSLLNAKYVGTPYLSFSLSPRPLELLSLDPSDPNLWFSQLLARRSSGIEGLQEFTAVIVVPRDEDFCVNARLRRVCLLDVPPGPLNFDERYTGSAPQLGRVLNYLERVYPIGTDIDELDEELIGKPTPPESFPRPVIRAWEIASVGGFLGPLAWVVAKGPNNAEHNVDAFYKHPLEIWLDTQEDEYERDSARSPLERGVLLGEVRTLDTCFAWNEGALAFSNSNSSIAPLIPLNVHPGDFDFGGVSVGALATARSVRERAVATITRWNALERQLATFLSNRRTFPKKPTKFNDPRVIRVLIDRLAKLDPEDSRNLDFNSAVTALGLNAEQKRILKSAGATDLRSIASALKSASVIERYNEDAGRLKKLDSKRKSPIQPVAFPISAATSDGMRRAIGETFAKNLSAASERP